MAKNSKGLSPSNAPNAKPATAEQLIQFARDKRFLLGSDPNAIQIVPAPGVVTPTRVAFGPPVIRSADFLSLEIGLVNLRVEVPAAGKGMPTLIPSGRGRAYIVLRFPPQSIAEQVFYEIPDQNVKDVDASVPPGSKTEPGGNEALADPPIKSRIAGRSRVAFIYDEKLLAKAGIARIEYTLAGILDACRHLPLSIARNAQRQPVVRLVVGGKSSLLGAQRRAFGKFTVSKRAAVLADTLRNLQLIARHGADAANLLLRRAELNAETLNAHLPTTAQNAQRAAARSPRPERSVPLYGTAIAAVSAIRASRLQVAFVPTTRFLIQPPVPHKPTATETALEMPFRLLLSPNESGRFVHDPQAFAFPATGRTPIWHSRLGTYENGAVLEGPGSGTEVRAIWARVGPESSPAYFNGAWSNRVNAKHTEQPEHSNEPFRATLDDFDRFNIVHLSSNFSLVGGDTEPVECKRLMLSALGGWMDVRGAWKVPDGLAVEEWVHQSTQARDHYVKVVYKGYLLPFGHRVSLVKVSERKFHHAKGKGNPAYLRQRMFMIIREPVRDFPVMHLAGDTPYGRYYHREFPFARVRILTRVTPNLADPALTDIDNKLQSLFWPAVPAAGQAQGIAPYAFSYVGTDLDGNEVKFKLPAIFIDNTLANPGSDPGRLLAEDNFKKAQKAYLDPGARSWRTAAFGRQRVALAASHKPGDTSFEMVNVTFGAEVAQLRFDSATQHGPLMYPTFASAEVRIPCLAYLAGGDASNTVTWNRDYVGQAQGFNAGEVFLDVEPGGGALDFSKQGNRSGGFVQPNLAPSGVSRLSGPISGDVDQFAGGQFKGSDFFKSLSPLLFGCIPLGEVISAFNIDSSNLGKLPKFVTEAASVAQTVFTTLGQTHDLAGSLPSLAQSAVAGALRQAVALAMHELAAQIAVLDAATASIASLITAAENAANTAAATFESAANAVIDPAELSNALKPLTDALAPLLAATSQRLAELPDAGLSETVNTIVAQQLKPLAARIAQVQKIVADIQKLPDLIDAAADLAQQIGCLLVPPDQLKALLDNPLALQQLLDKINAALATFQPLMAGVALFEGALKKTALDALTGLAAITAKADELIALLTALFGDQITVRFAWQPEIAPWPAPGSSLYGSLGTLFKPNDKKAFIIAVEAKVKKSSGEVKARVQCALRHFDLILLGENNAFMGLAFEKIEFNADSSLKMDVDVVLDAIHFLGPLKFVETLKDLIPLDGFSDPPALDISEKGIDASFSLSLPNLSVGVLNLSNLSLGAGFCVPFIGQPLSVRFNFCTREQPFCLTVAMFGGGGFFGLTVDPHGVQVLEASFEFGAAIAIDFGVASGGVHVMAGIYFRMENSACSLTGYFRLGGEVEVLCIISASLELYLGLSYQFDTGKCCGEATLTISVSLFLFSISVSIHCQRQFAGSNGDPPFAALMGPDEPLTLDTRYPWRDYVEAFA